MTPSTAARRPCATSTARRTHCGHRSGSAAAPSGSQILPADRSGTALTGQLAEYEAPEVERNFAQQAYASALSSLETARVDASRQQRHLAVYAAPALPQYPLYPRRILNGVLIFLGLALTWGIGALIVYAVRDHIA